MPEELVKTKTKQFFYNLISEAQHLKNCEIWEFYNKRKSIPSKYKTGIWNLDKEKKIIPVLCKRFLGTNHVLPVGHWYVEYGSTGTQLEVLAWRNYLKYILLLDVVTTILATSLGKNSSKLIHL